MVREATDLRGSRLCIAVVGVALLALVVYFPVAWGRWAQFHSFGIGAGALGLASGVWSWWDTVIRTRQGLASAWGPLVVVVLSVAAIATVLNHP